MAVLTLYKIYVKTKYDKELMMELVKSEYSWAKVMFRLDLKPTGGNYTYIKKLVNYYGIDYSHFTGKAWNKGMTVENSESLRKMSENLMVPNEDVFKLNGHPLHNSKLTKRLIQIGWDYKCQICGLQKWLNKKISLHLDHINGNSSDNRFENLRFLCPNCHQQTPTWGRKKDRALLAQLAEANDLGS